MPNEPTKREKKKRQSDLRGNNRDVDRKRELNHNYTFSIGIVNINVIRTFAQYHLSAISLLLFERRGRKSVILKRRTKKKFVRK